MKFSSSVALAPLGLVAPIVDSADERLSVSPWKVPPGGAVLLAGGRKVVVLCELISDASFYNRVMALGGR